MTRASDVDRLCIERDCSRLVLDSLHFNDVQQYERLAELFTDEAEFYRPADPEIPIRGREAILANYRQRASTRVTRHVCTNMRVDIDSAREVVAHCYLLVYAGEREPSASSAEVVAAPRPPLVGEFIDRIVSTANGWRIACRRARFVLQVQA